MDEDLRFGLSINWAEQRVCILGLPCPPPPLKLTLSFEGGFIVTGDKLMLTLTAVQRCLLSITAVDAKGNPAAVEDVVFDVSDPTVLRIDRPASVQPNEAYVVAVGPVGTAQVRVTADADIGEGVQALNGLLDVEVVAGAAVALGIGQGTPEDNPEINPQAAKAGAAKRKS